MKNDIRIQNQSVSQVHNASPSFDAEDCCIKRGDDGFVNPTKSPENLRRTLSKEDDEDTSSTKRTSESAAKSPKIIDLSKYEDGGLDECQLLDQKNSSDERPQRRQSSTKRSMSIKGKRSSSKRKSKRASAVQMSGEISEKSPKTPKKKKKITKQVSAIESQQPASKLLVTPHQKSNELPTKRKATSSPATPTKTRNSMNKKSAEKKSTSVDDGPNDFQRRKEAKGKRKEELHDYLGTLDSTLMVEHRSDDSVSYLTMPLALRGEGGQGRGDLDKLPKGQTPKTINPMIRSMMGDGGEGEAGRRISYDLEALMSHRAPARQISNKWESVSVITDDVETVFGNGGPAVDIISLQSHGIKFCEGDEEMGMNTVDLEQPSEDATTDVAFEKEAKVSLASILEDAEALMMRRPISASVTFVFLVATLVFLGIALVKTRS